MIGIESLRIYLSFLVLIKKDLFPVVVVSYGENSLAKLCPALSNYEMGPVIIADNSSLESNRELAHEQSWTYIPLDNLGYGRAFNRVIIPYLDTAKGFIILNDDLELKELQLELFVEDAYQYCLAHPNVGPIAPVYSTVPKNESKKQVARVDFCAAAMWFLSINLLHEVGGFHEDFFMYGEDKEYCYRSRFHGFSPVVLMHHHVVHPFDYPPSDIALWSEMIKNTLKAISLDLNEDRENAIIHGFKMLIVSAFTGQLLRFKLTLGALINLVNSSLSIRSKRSFLSKAHPYRFIQT